MTDQPERPVVHPGDIVQDADGVLYLTETVNRWGLGVILRWRSGSDIHEHYVRLKHGDYHVAGQAPMLPPELLADRRASVATHEAVEREKGT